MANSVGRCRCRCVFINSKNLGNWILVMYFIVGIVVNAVVNDLVRL